MFKTIDTGKDLNNLNLKAEAKLSDMFFLLYALYFFASHDVKISKIGIQKFITYLLDTLEKEGALDKNHYFNLPLYKWKFGTYNEAIKTRYINELIGGDLVKIDSINYLITNKGVEFIEEFIEHSDEKNDKIEFLEKTLTEFNSKYLKDGDVFGKLKNYSHNIKVKFGNEIKKVDDLESKQSIAVMYNSIDFVDGKKSDLVPEEFLTKLSFIIQENKQLPDDETDRDLILSQIL